MEEPRNLEISVQGNLGFPKQDLPGYMGQLFELEYGVTGWWSSALYLEGASQRHDSTVFTGFRLENRFKPFKGEHQVNPILYLEYENINEASRIQKEIVGHAEPSDESFSELRAVIAREIEAKLILSSNLRSWNFSENFIVEKNLTGNEGLEFIQQETDGAIFWKISAGNSRPRMPGYSSIPEAQRWQLVLYIRSLGKR
jgi:hypothetical protein